MKLRTLLNRVFRLEEINGDGRCPTYLYRWTLLRLGKFAAVYLHKFVGEDWSTHFHDHPKRFISIGLRGSYVEITPNPARLETLTEDGRDPMFFPCGCSCMKVDVGLCDEFSHYTRTFRAPWIRTFSAEHTHRLTGPTPAQPCWTLVIVGRPVREWGFWVRNEWVEFRRYIGSDAADAGKACP